MRYWSQSYAGKNQTVRSSFVGREKQPGAKYGLAFRRRVKNELYIFSCPIAVLLGSQKLAINVPRDVLPARGEKTDRIPPSSTVVYTQAHFLFFFPLLLFQSYRSYRQTLHRYYGVFHLRSLQLFELYIALFRITVRTIMGCINIMV